MRLSLLCLPAVLGCIPLCGCSPAKPFNSSFDVAVTFTPAAVAALKNAGAAAQADVLYTGRPTEAAKPKANEGGLIEMGEDFASLQSASQTVHIAGAGFYRDSLTAILDNDVTLNIRVYSDTRLAKPVIACAPVTVALGSAQAKPPTIACDAVQ